MSYYYSDPTRESDPHALPNVEVWWCDEYADTAAVTEETEGYFYAFGFPGCVWDGDPVGPFDTEAEALADARGEG